MRNLKVLLLFVFVLCMGLFAQSQNNRFEKMFRELDQKMDSISKAEKERQDEKLFEESWQIAMSVGKDSVTTLKRHILMMCWMAYIDGGCNYRDKGEFDYEGFVNRMKVNKWEVNSIERHNQFWKELLKKNNRRRRK